MTRTKHDNREAAVAIIKQLRASGYTALFAGGCVRDMLLERPAKDHDVVTDATPDHLTELYPRARRVGAKFGVILVRKFGHDIEVATFRTEGAYSDGRRPDSVTFATDREDAARRDFTINGLFYDPLEDRVFDYVNGRADVAARVIRTIGDPGDRFGEDHLRMLRAVRFAAALDFAIDPDTMSALRVHAPKLRAISTERIWMELERILTDPSRATGWRLILESGLRPYLVEEWTPNDALDHGALARLAALPEGPIGAAPALAAVLHAYDVKQAGVIARGLKLSNSLCGSVLWMLRSLPLLREPESIELADLKTLMSRAEWPDLLSLFAADLEVSRGEMKIHEAIRERAAAIPRDRIAPPPLLTGDDLVAMGFEPGPAFGRILDAIYRAQLNETLHTRVEAVEIAQGLAGQRPTGQRSAGQGPAG